jgi:hypothetical protein
LGLGGFKINCTNGSACSLRIGSNPSKSTFQKPYYFAVQVFSWQTQFFPKTTRKLSILIILSSTLPSQSHIFSDLLFVHDICSIAETSPDGFWYQNIIVEGIGDVYVRVAVSGKSILLFRFRNSWHVASSPIISSHARLQYL